MNFQKFLNFLIKKYSHATLWNFLWLLLPFSLASIASAHAYIDPSAGSYVVQIVIGAIFGASFALKNVAGKMVKYIKDYKLIEPMRRPS